LENQAFPFTSELHVAQQEKNGQKKKVPVTVFHLICRVWLMHRKKSNSSMCLLLKRGLKQTAKEDCWRRSERNLCAFCFKIQALLWNRMTLNFEEVFYNYEFDNAGRKDL